VRTGPARRRLDRVYARCMHPPSLFPIPGDEGEGQQGRDAREHGKGEGQVEDAAVFLEIPPNRQSESLGLDAVRAPELG
jgi:hypothetical protein